MKKRFTAILAAAAMTVSSVPAVSAPFTASAATTTCFEITGSNAGKNAYQGYDMWSTPDESFMTKTSDGYMCVRHIASTRVMVFYFDNDYNFVSVKEIQTKYGIFGGFAESSDYYFIASGQNNLQQTAGLAGFNITKYDKNWNKISDVELADCNTRKPFDCGGMLTVVGDYLYVYCGHEMYSEDLTQGHQSNMTIKMNIDTMAVEHRTLIGSLDYCSHSFEQLMCYDSATNSIFTANHGDAYPRSIVVTKRNPSVALSSYTGSKKEVFAIQGAEGANVTGVTLGGLAVTKDSVITVANSVVQDSSYASRTTKNVFVTSTDKNLGTTKTIWLTDLAEGETTTTTPKLVKIDDSNLLTLWTQGGNVWASLLDSNGNPEQTISFKGEMSDCQPIAENGVAEWYVQNGNSFDFYSVDTSDMSYTIKTSVCNAGHDYKLTGTNGYYKELECSKCGKQTDVYWQPVYTHPDDTSGLYWSSAPDKIVKGDTCKFWLKSFDTSKSFSVSTSDPSIATVKATSSNMGTIEVVGDGYCEIKIYYTECPEVYDTIYVNGISSVSASIKNSISLNFIVPKQKTSVSGYKMTKNGEDVIGSRKDMGDYYVFSYSDINAKNINDKIALTVNFKNGATDTVEYSVRDYCMKVIGMPDAQLKAAGVENPASLRMLCGTMLMYGSAAQNYFSYNTSSLANSALTSAQKTQYSSSSVTSVNATALKKNSGTASAAWKTGGLNLLDKAVIRLKFSYDGNVSDLALKVDVKGTDKYYAVNKFEKADDNGNYYAYFDNLTVLDLNTEYDFTLYKGGTIVSDTLTYSVGSYVKTVLASAKSTELTKTLVTRLDNYCTSAIAYKE